MKVFQGCSKVKYPLLIAFCINSPHMQIRMENYISYRSDCINSSVGIYQYVLRKRIPFLESLNSNARATLANFGESPGQMATRLPSLASPDNLRVFPRPEPFDETEFRTSAKRDLFAKHCLTGSCSTKTLRRMVGDHEHCTRTSCLGLCMVVCCKG